MTAQQDITLYAKRDNTLDITIMTVAGNPVDLTQYKLQLTIKGLATDPDSDSLYQGPPSLTNRTFGRFCFLVPLVTTSNAAWAAVVDPGERTIASGVTHLVRLCAWAIAPGFAGLLMGGTAPVVPLYVGAGLKILYDILLWRAFRAVRPPEET